MSKKSRKLIRSAGTIAAEPVAEVAVVLPEFFFLPQVDPVPVSERQLHQEMKLWRHGRATRTLGQVLQDGYVMLFSVVVITAMIASVVVRAQSGMATCSTSACISARLLLPSATVLASFGLALSAARLFGPILASAAEGFWLMDAPISRRRLLRGRVVLPLLLSWLVATLITALVAALSGMAWVQVLAWSQAAGLGSAALVAFAATEQPRERTWVLRALGTVFSAGALAILLVVVAIAAGWLSPSMASLAGEATWLLVGLGVLSAVVMAGLVPLVIAGLDRIRRARLLSGGSLVSGMQGAMYALDFGLIRDILVERRMVQIGHVRSGRGPGVGISALIWRDVQRLRRSPGAFVGLGMSLLVPYAADALRIIQLNPLISGVALVIGLVPFLGGLRVLTRTGGLARALPFRTSQIRTASMAVPAVLALVWAFAATPAFVGIALTGQDRSLVDGLAAAGVTAAAGLLGAVRWVTAKKVDFQAPMMATESGALPPALIFNLFRGLDMVVLITAPLILQAPAYWSGAIALVVFAFLRGGFNMQELQAQQEAAKRDLERAKAGGTAGARRQVPRPQR